MKWILKISVIFCVLALSNLGHSAGFRISLYDGKFYGPGNLGMSDIHDGSLENFIVTAPMTGKIPFLNNGLAAASREMDREKLKRWNRRRSQWSGPLSCSVRSVRLVGDWWPSATARRPRIVKGADAFMIFSGQRRWLVGFSVDSPQTGRRNIIHRRCEANSLEESWHIRCAFLSSEAILGN